MLYQWSAQTSQSMRRAKRSMYLGRTLRAMAEIGSASMRLTTLISITAILTYIYTNGDVIGSATFDQASLGDTPLAPGGYEMRLFLDDGYAILASTPFIVTE
jgi:hypothetical protein